MRKYKERIEHRLGCSIRLLLGMRNGGALCTRVQASGIRKTSQRFPVQGLNRDLNLTVFDVVHSELYVFQQREIYQ